MQRRCGQGVVACCCKQPTRRTQSASGKLSQHRSVIKAGPKTGLSGSEPSTAGVYIKRALPDRRAHKKASNSFGAMLSRQFMRCSAARGGRPQRRGCWSIHCCMAASSAQRKELSKKVGRRICAWIHSRGQGGNRARDNPCRRTTRQTPTVPEPPKKQQIEFVRACAAETHLYIKQKQESAVNTTRNARGQKSTPHFVRACAVETHFNIKQKHESAVHTTQNARGQKSPTHFVRACAVETHFDIKQEHESAVNTTQNARGQSGHLNLAPRPFLLP